MSEAGYKLGSRNLSDASPLISATGLSPAGLPQVPGRSPRASLRNVAVAVPMLGTSWALIWTQSTFWNPMFFAGLWVGATLLMYAGGQSGYPGWRLHVLLAVVSVTLWWWFELVNSRAGNWEYINRYDYNPVQYFLLASVAFSTVVPALHSAWGLTLRILRPDVASRGAARRHGYLAEQFAGIGTVALTFALPSLFFPLIWVGPFLICDGLVGYTGGRSLAQDMLRGEWRVPAAIGLAGLMCGFLWEFWNFWSTPKWVYHIQYLEFLQVFEMPLLGYIGYIPFTWSVYQLLRLRPLDRYVRARP